MSFLNPEMRVVVTGLPRSGTSLVMSMLQAGGMPVLCDQSRPPDQDNPRGYFEYSPIRRLATEPDCLSGIHGNAVKVVIPLVRFLGPTFGFRFIWINRSFKEVLASQTAMLSRRGMASAGPEPLLHRAMQKQVEETEEWLAMRPEIPVLRLEHGNVITDPAAAADAINGFLDLQLDTAAMAACVDPALYRQRVVES